MKKNMQNKKNRVTEIVKALPQELLDQLAKEYKRDQDLIRTQYQLKVIMSRTYISKLIH